MAGAVTLSIFSSPLLSYSPYAPDAREQAASANLGSKGAAEVRISG